MDTSEWKTTNRRYVGLVDIMGFKDRVARSSHSDVYNMMKKINEKRTRNANISWGDNPNLIRTTTYSDSIMVYSKDDSEESLHSCICTLSSLSYDLFLAEVPHKGGLAFGEMTLDQENSIFFGQPLIDAFLLQEELLFYGIIVHGSAEENIQTKSEDGPYPFTKNYLCPLKNGMAQHITIYPMFTGSRKNPTQEKNMMTSFKRLRYSTSGQLRRYVDNTELYLESVREKKES